LNVAHGSSLERTGHNRFIFHEGRLPTHDDLIVLPRPYHHDAYVDLLRQRISLCSATDHPSHGLTYGSTSRTAITARPSPSRSPVSRTGTLVILQS
jgi:hypothetical protein